MTNVEREKLKLLIEILRNLNWLAHQKEKNKD